MTEQTDTPARDALIETLTYSAVPYDEARKQVGAMLDDLRGRKVVLAALVEADWRPDDDDLRTMGGVRLLDEHDDEVYREAFTLAEAARRFLRRQSTYRATDLGFLDVDVMTDLIESSDRMWLIRTQRVGAARRPSQVGGLDE